MKKTADDCMREQQRAVGRPPEKRSEAMTWLENFLAGGEKPFKEIEAAWEAVGFSADTIRQAAKKIGVKKRSEGFGKDKVGYWSLPFVIAPPIDADNSLIYGETLIDGVNTEIAGTLKI
jgi:hypothetical protein